MKIILETTDVNDDFLLDMSSMGIKLVEVTRSPNNWIDCVYEGSEIDLFKFYLKYWCEPSLWLCHEEFQMQIVKD